MSHWRAQNERVKYELREIELMKIEGECLLSKDLYITMGATYASLASGLIRFPYNAGPYVTGFTEVHEVIRILEDEITGLLTAFFGTEYLADDFLPKLIRETPIENVPGVPRDVIFSIVEKAILSVMERIGKQQAERRIHPTPPAVEPEHVEDLGAFIPKTSAPPEIKAAPAKRKARKSRRAVAPVPPALSGASMRAKPRRGAGARISRQN